MELIDGKDKKLKEDLEEEIKTGSIISIIASNFSIYAFDQLKEKLKNIKEFRFIFDSPTFIDENPEKVKREFYIPRIEREKTLYGSEFEVKLKNEMNQKAIAKECADWIKEKAIFKSNTNNILMKPIMCIDDKIYNNVNGFTTVDLGLEKGNMAYNIILKISEAQDKNIYKEYVKEFNKQWNDKTRIKEVTNLVINNITTVYKENSPDYIFFVTLFNIFKEFLEDISDDELPNELTGFKDSKIWNMLYNFQEDAVLSIINKLEKYNGCILADSVGLGKTFTALAVIKYYESRNKSVLVLCPKKLANNWNTYKANYINNPIAEDRMNYDVLFHTDLNREKGESNGLELDRVNWGNYDLVVIDESHNFRNGGKISKESEKENRYLKLLNKVLKKGVKTKVLMLSATPVNNRFTDLKNQLALAYEGDSSTINKKLKTNKDIDNIFKQAQTDFNNWSKLESELRTTDNLIRMLDNDFFELLDSVTIARSRKHVQRYYDTKEVGSFPNRKPPISKRPGLSSSNKMINYNEIFEQLNLLKLSIYTPTKYILESKKLNYKLREDEKNLTQEGREKGIRRLMAINLLKRLESSVNSFKLTLERINLLINNTLETIRKYEKNLKSQELKLDDYSYIDLDGEDQEDDVFYIGHKVSIKLEDMDYMTWQKELEEDKNILELLLLMISDIEPKYDEKLKTLLETIDEKQKNPLNPGNKKILIFTAFADTADYLYDNVSKYVKEKYGLNTAIITGTTDGKMTKKKVKTDINTVLTLFSPISKNKKLLMPNEKEEIDILIATDCISEGQNLQDCDYLINYDIHWNPVRIIQRFGRIDRIGSKNESIQLVNFWPNISLDEYINLKSRVETRMKIVNITATGDDNMLSPEEKNDLEYRKKQLEKLQEEVIDIEDMNTGISIMDLGLNEFRLDLLDYIKKNPEIEKAPSGMNALVYSQEDFPKGVIFILKNLEQSVNINNRNRLHPFYMVYLTEEGEVFIDHLEPKKILDSFRLLCRGKKEPNLELCAIFNKETDDGKNMKKYSELLETAISSMIEVKEEDDIESFLSGKNMSFLSDKIEGIDDFELISFLVIRDKEDKNA